LKLRKKCNVFCIYAFTCYAKFIFILFLCLSLVSCLLSIIHVLFYNGLRLELRERTLVISVNRTTVSQEYSRILILSSTYFIHTVTHSKILHLSRYTSIRDLREIVFPLVAIHGFVCLPFDRAIVFPTIYKSEEI